MFSWLRRRLGSPDHPRLEVAEPTDLGRASNAFASNLTRALGLPEDAVLGPQSTFDLLAQLLPLAGDTTETELLQVLGTSQEVGARRERQREDPQVTIHSATAVFAPPAVSLRDDLVATGLHVEQLPEVGSAQRINGWVADMTQGKLARLVTDEDCAALRQLLMVDALYFDGRWRYPFEPERTAPALFASPTGPVEVATMTVEAPLYAATDGGPVLVSLPYQGERFALDIVVGLDPSDVDGWLTRRRAARRREVRLRLPRFSVDPPALELRPALEAMGLHAIFDAKGAELPGLGPGPLWLDRLVHRARIDVDEAGTVAAAATVGFGQQSRDPDALVLHIDRPFSFFLHDTVDPTVLFVGQVANPSRS